MPGIDSYPQMTSPLTGTENFIGNQGGVTKRATPQQIVNDLGGGLANVTTTDPVATDDSGSGYQAGSRWVNTTNNTIWVCYDATLTAAVWERIDGPKLNSAGGGAPTVSNDNTQGYEAGSIWIDEVNDAVYFCESAGTGAASWIQSGGGGGGAAGSGYTRSALVTKSANQTGIVNSGLVTFDTVVHDSDGIFNNGTDLFEAPVGGYYLFTAHVQYLNQSTADDVYLEPTITSALSQPANIRWGRDNPAVSFPGIQGSIVIQLEAGDTVGLTATGDASFDIRSDGAYMSLTLLSAGATVASDLAEVIVSSPTATINIDVSAFSGEDLVIEVLGDTDRAGQPIAVMGVQFNSDTGSNYDSTYFDRDASDGEAGSGSDGVNLTSLRGFNVAGATAPANTPGGGTITVPAFKNTSFYKLVHGQGFTQRSVANADTEIAFFGGLWKSTAAITSVQLIVQSGDNFIAGTIVRAYSRGGAQIDSYSTTEVATNKRWIDGKIIYRKAVYFAAGPNATTINTPHGVTGLDRWTDVSIRADNGAGTGYTKSGLSAYCDSTNVYWAETDNRSTFTGYAILEYTKT